MRARPADDESGLARRRVALQQRGQRVRVCCAAEGGSDERGLTVSKLRVGRRRRDRGRERTRNEGDDRDSECDAALRAGRGAGGGRPERRAAAKYLKAARAHDPVGESVAERVRRRRRTRGPRGYPTTDGKGQDAGSRHGGCGRHARKRLRPVPDAGDGIQRECACRRHNDARIVRRVRLGGAFTSAAILLHMGCCIVGWGRP